ncbi:MAG: hypothetical protein GY805_35695, partial [Chloroflexi bacterium]|nr:hypothetical protein [Chloroflexota bacterium]
MKVKAVGNQFWLYWDGEEIAGSPFTDPDAALDKGYFGAYVWDMFSPTPPTVKIDNIVVKEESLYYETFANGTASLNWFSAWNDSIGNQLSPMVATNETGPTDEWIGVVTGDTATLGSLGSALAGDAELNDYSVEADVYVELATGYYNGLMIRADTTDRVQGYQFISNFYSPYGSAKVRFRYFHEVQENIRILADISAADLPGGAPSEDGWHKMKVKAVGNQFWLYWDGEEIAGSPFTDPDAA